MGDGNGGREWAGGEGIAEAELTEQYFEHFGDRVPSEMWNQLSELRARLR